MNRNSMVFIGMGFECVGVVLVCLYIGRWLDEKYGFGGFGAMTGALIGLIGWVIHLLAVARTLAKEEESGHTDGQ